MKNYSFDDLLDIVKQLRSENGCPWDKEQTKESLKAYILEESYEVIDVCDIGGEKLADELGDLLLQIVMLAQICSETEEFDINNVINCISRKMIHRHPHVFGNEIANTSDEVLKNWDHIKNAERKISTCTDSLKDVTKTLPSLTKAYKVQSKAAKVGFDWNETAKAIEKLEEETTELKQAYNSGNKNDIHEETGDLLFAAVNVSRFMNINPEIALNDSTKKFINRFEYIEKTATSGGKKLEDMSLDEMDILWDEAKLLEKK